MAKADYHIEGIPVHIRLMDEDQSNFPAERMEPDYITVHETENYDKGANAWMHSNYLLNEAYGRYVSWHFTVDDSRIIQHAKLTQTCWHSGDGNGPGNTNSIGIETCENSDGDFEEAVENVQALIRYLQKTKRGLEQIEPHRRWSGKNCPSNILDEWDSFKHEVKTGDKTGVHISYKPSNTDYSIVDYLNSQNMDSSFDARKEYARMYDVAGYEGTAEQNLLLLAKMQQGKSSVKGDNKTNSIVEYLESIDEDSSFANRANLADQYGLDDYKGTASQNTELLAILRGEKEAPEEKKVEKVTLPETVDQWGTYTLDELPVSENISWYLTPSAFGGLTYEILDKPYHNVVTIKTSRGKRNIYVGDDTSAKIH